MFWFDKQNKNAVFMDERKHYEELSSGHVINVNPDVVADFRNMPFEDESFYHVVFDPPHLLKAGDNSWLAKKYGKLNSETWKEDLALGFKECFRVLKINGTLVFKWNEEQIKLSEILKLIDAVPLYGNKRAKTHWLVFMKEEHDE
ncbi:class I SAM-dependent methyltransferase [Enterococcus thailandicus]|uniref:class I SAM-dependent methyltransferase n=1 Tax=Enterococcus thailandicus TaxID=417368 RepID=UPI0034DD4889